MPFIQMHQAHNSS